MKLISLVILLCIMSSCAQFNQMTNTNKAYKKGDIVEIRTTPHKLYGNKLNRKNIFLESDEQRNGLVGSLKQYITDMPSSKDKVVQNELKTSMEVYFKARVISVTPSCKAESVLSAKCKANGNDANFIDKLKFVDWSSTTRSNILRRIKSKKKYNQWVAKVEKSKETKNNHQAKYIAKHKKYLKTKEGQRDRLCLISEMVNQGNSFKRKVKNSGAITYNQVKLANRYQNINKTFKKYKSDYKKSFSKSWSKSICKSSQSIQTKLEKSYGLSMDIILTL